MDLGAWRVWRWGDGLGVGVSSGFGSCASHRVCKIHNKIQNHQTTTITANHTVDKPELYVYTAPTMELITTRMRIKGIAVRFERALGRRHPETLLALQKLDLNTATAKEVNTIIGNSTWIDLTCDECGKLSERVVRLGEEPDCESSTALICPTCLTLALTLAEK